ncbi:MAG: mechanosensitive ion channel protein MscS, partial [Pseudomonadota bacterium]
MTLLSPLKVRFTPLVVLFTVLALTMSSFIVRATESSEALAEAPTVSAAEQAIDNINKDIIDLSGTLKL